MYDKTEIKRILIQRDGDSSEEAKSRIDEAQAEIDAIIEDGECNIMAIEQVIEDSFGLEPDYVMDFIPLN